MKPSLLSFFGISFVGLLLACAPAECVDVTTNAPGPAPGVPGASNSGLQQVGQSILNGSGPAGPSPDLAIVQGRQQTEQYIARLDAEIEAVRSQIRYRLENRAEWDRLGSTGVGGDLDVEHLVRRTVQDLRLPLVDTRIDLGRIPDPPPSSLPYRFETPEGPHRQELVGLYQDLYKANPKYERHKRVRELGLRSVEVADRSYAAEEVVAGDYYRKLAEGFLDLAIGLDPITGTARSAYELLTGRNFVTGVSLTSFERSLAFVGVLSLGTTREVEIASKGLLRIARHAAHLVAPELPRAIEAGEGVAKAAGTVWHSITATQEFYAGTFIPKSFELVTRFGSVWVHPNATKHVLEYVTQKSARLTPEGIRLATQLELSSLHAAVELFLERGLKPGRGRMGAWELALDSPSSPEKLLVLYHAVNKR